MVEETGGGAGGGGLEEMLRVVELRIRKPVGEWEEKQVRGGCRSYIRDEEKESINKDEGSHSH